jgi:hypothetical protein
LFFDGQVIGGVPHHFATGAHPSSLEASAAGKNDHDVFAKARRHAGLPYPKTFAGTHHQNDGDNAPRDSEHRQQRSKLVAPERLHRVTK